jgi:hypothetical protein
VNSNAPLNQVQVEHEIMRLVQILEDETEAYAALVEDEAKKDAHLKHAWASEYIKNVGKPQKEREAWADYKLETPTYVHKVAKALAIAKKEKLNSVRSSIDALRTIAANVRHMT